MNRKDLLHASWAAIFVIVLLFSGALALSKIEGMPFLSRSVEGLVEIQEGVVLILGVIVIALLLFARRRV